MQKTKRMHFVNKAVGLFCVLVLLVCALYVPVVFSASAIASVDITEDTAVVFDFENVVKSENENKEEATGEAGIGYFGWGGQVKAYKDEAGNVTNTVLSLSKTDANAWVTKGGYRIHKQKEDGSYGFYELSPSSKYVVSFKIRVMSAPVTVEGSKETNKAEVMLGYNSLYNPNASGQGTNYINDIKTQIPVVSSLIDSETFTLVDTDGNATTYKYSEDWINVRYFIDTPASFTNDPALAFWATKYYGFDCEIDDVSVVKVGAKSGMVILADEYSGVEEVLFGKIGTAVTLPDISDKAHNSDHAFEGWYVNVDRTEKAENLTFGETVQTVYSRWKAPVTITFKDTVNNTEQKIVGSAGDSFNYPADPVDPSNESWFMGWYADEAGIKEHTSGKFGYADATIYAYFKGRIPGIDQGFEDYTHDAYTVKYDANGQAYKSNRLVFGPTLSKQSEVTYNNSGYAVKFHWSPVAIEDKANEHYYDVNRFRAKDNYFHIGSGLEEGQVYIVTFKYKAEMVNAPINFYMLSGVYNNGWGDRVEYVGIDNLEINQSDEWQEATFQFIPAYINGANHMYLGVSLTVNEETVIYFDDVKVEAFAQPYESVAHFYTGVNDEVIHVKGVRGEEIKFPEVTHPLGGTLKGWYTDPELTVSAENATYQRKEINLYAKWIEYSGFVQDFENYTRDQWSLKETVKNNGTPDDTSDDYKAVYKSNYLDFYTTMSKQSEVVYGGKYAVKFHWNTDPAFDKDVSKPDGFNISNPESYEHKRYASGDNYFNIGKNLENNQVYNISFKYKVEKGNQNVQFYTITGVAGNAWGNRVVYNMPETVDLKPGDWQEISFEFTTAMKADTDHLFFGVTLSEHEDVIMYFDDIKVQSVINSEEIFIFINNGYEVEQMRHIGTKGEEINLPALTHPDGAKFLGWYTDAALTTPFTETVYPQSNAFIYAKWGASTMSFITYPYLGHPYTDPYINIEHKNGIGNGDDYAMHWKLKRTVADTSGVGTSRAFVIYKGLEEGGIYRVKFDYKGNRNNNKQATLSVVSGDWRSIWWSKVLTTYPASTVTIPEGGTDGWQTQEVYINADIKSFVDENGNHQIADTLYLRFSAQTLAEAGTDMDVLVDNVLVEKIEAPYIFFDGQNRKNGVMARGEAGDEINFPATPERIGYNFAGWYLDPECTVKFTQKTFEEDTAITVYANWTKASTAVYSFENYTPVDGVGLSLKDGEAVKKNAKTGKYSMYFGNRTPGNYESRSYFAFEDSGEYFQLEYDSQYVITFNYLIKEYGDSGLNISFIASWGENIWVGLNAGKHSQVGVNQPITLNMARRQKGKWCQMSFAVDTNDLEFSKDANRKELDNLFAMITGGENWEIYFDDITITKIPKGKNLVVVHSEGAKDAPKYFTGKTGEDYTSKLPETIVNDDLYFKGYYTMTADGSYLELTRKEMNFGDRALVVFARFLEYETSENFDNGYYDKAYSGGIGYTIHDFDYEVYDSEKDGYSKDNVTSGRYSLHRKGNSMYKENAVILTLGNQIAEGERYRVSFKVKLGKHLHTDGAVKIVSSRSFEYAWTTTGDYYAVAPIADLTDGQWHEVSYVFNSVEAFVCVQTPGYVELYMDDFKFELVGEDVALSEPPVYTEYVAAKRDANGNLIKKNRADVDVTSIIDASLNKSPISPILYVIIGLAAVLVIAGGVVAIILIKKKKSKNV